MPVSKKQTLIFSEDNSLVIAELLAKYGLEEPLEEIFEKTNRSEKTFGNTVAKIVKKSAEEEMPFKNLVSVLKTELNLSQKEADGLAKDIEERILSFVKKPSKAVVEPAEEKPPGPKEDIYREPIE